MKHEAIKLKLKLNYYCLIEAFSISTFFHSHLIQLTYKKKWAFWNIKLNSTYPFSRIEVKLIWKRKWVDEIDPEREREIELTFASSRRYDIGERNEVLLCWVIFWKKSSGNLIDTEEDKKYKRDVSGYEQRERVWGNNVQIFLFLNINVVRSWKQIMYVYVAFIYNVRKSSIICVHLRNGRE